LNRYLTFDCIFGILSLVGLFFNGIARATPTVFLQDRLMYVFKPLWASIDGVVWGKKVLGRRFMSEVAQVKAVAVESLHNRFGKDLEARNPFRILG